MLMYSLLTLSILNVDHSQLVVIDTPHDFKLTTQNDKDFKFSQLRGKVLLVGFVFTTCNGSCPATTHHMAKVQDQLIEEKLTKDVHLLTITLDPKRDTPVVLRRYMSLFDLKEDSWTFLTGKPEVVKKVHDDWKMWTKPTTNGQLDHPSRMFLVDQQGRIREIYNLGFFKAKWAMADIQSLLKE